MPTASLPSPHSRLTRALRLRCPSCGARGIVAGWLRLAARCPHCAFRPDRGEPDHFLGGYVVSLGIAEGVAAILWVVLLTVTWPNPPWVLMQWAAAVLVVVTPVLLYPFTRLLFLAVDLIAQPHRPGDFGSEDPTFK
ncbi:MAG: DUF983 domain-containing protein [Gemmatimonadetes bacterium]|nr:DUF983 domain-containing protein [Gemmatimonadota bacterium]